MDEESNGSILTLIWLLFLKDHTWPEFLFLYFLIHIILSLKFKVEDYWGSGSQFIHNKEDSIPLLLAKPFFVLIGLALPVIGVMIYTLILAFFASFVIEHLPNFLPTFKVGHMTINGGDFKMPEFNIRKMIFEGSGLAMVIYFYCYAGLRNKELADLKSKN